MPFFFLCVVRVERKGKNSKKEVQKTSLESLKSERGTQKRSSEERLAKRGSETQLGLGAHGRVPGGGRRTRRKEQPARAPGRRGDGRGARRKVRGESLDKGMSWMTVGEPPTPKDYGF